MSAKVLFSFTSEHNLSSTWTFQRFQCPIPYSTYNVMPKCNLQWYNFTMYPLNAFFYLSISTKIKWRANNNLTHQGFGQYYNILKVHWYCSASPAVPCPHDKETIFRSHSSLTLKAYALPLLTLSWTDEKKQSIDGDGFIKHDWGLYLTMLREQIWRNLTTYMGIFM